MSYQTSIHFDPTALLIIKNEVDNSIKLVESAVSTLVEDQTLPFGIDDALNQFEQCAQVLALIDMPNLAQIAQYSAELMRKIMGNPAQVNTQDVIALSEGTTMLKRYIEFICLREVKIPQFLLDTLNRLELALGKPLTTEGQHIEPLLDLITPDFQLPQVPGLEKSKYVQRLYKLSLNKLLKQEESEMDLQAIKLVGTYLAGLSANHPSKQYWHLVHVAFDNIDHLLINEPRLRTLISIERNMAQYFSSANSFKASLSDLANVLSLCISQEDATAQQIRSQLNIGDDLLTDMQLQVFSRHLYGPDFETMHTISELVTAEMTQIRNDIEYNYQHMTPEKTQELQTQLNSLANIFKVLNLNEAYHDLNRQAASLSQADILKDESFAQQLMNVILSAMNSIGVLERHHTSSRLQLRVNNMNISLDRLDEAHNALLNETKALIELSSQILTDYLQDQDLTKLEPVPIQFCEIGGAMLFLNAEHVKAAFNTTALFIKNRIEQSVALTPAEIHHALDALASADMMIDNLKNKQPVLQSMFKVALDSSEKLKIVA
ncbi:chemotaxis protein [Acinetobacter variabilis]|uniref:chemotaxis protein n=1 Tax=Acinetobacter variabilis TaxID=70346 RepID=UPI001BB49957|nr:chemotaxis protein [Acinetobacter variabilis]MCU4365147.1 chemotaxis protein [Acinetobacter variabilis]MCU4375704.1 chemotaxis protein [Acinetobacter variabilis]UXI50588.1 chemotaxis protein [Acinetobacter variabilis]BCT89714.1 chemotaxis protein [Acinetobacter variabilis]